jgi:hypothetical protein
MLVLGYGVLWTTEDEETMQRHERQLITDTPPEGVEEHVPVEDDDAENDTELASNDDDDEQVTIETEDRQENKYNLDQFGTPEDDQEGEELDEQISTEPVPTRRHLTAKQRRDLKKGKPLDPPPETADNSDPDSGADSGVDDVTAALSTTSLSSKQKPPVRGKRGKAKKVKAKYADQSDEERELTRKLLGGKPPVEPKPEDTEPVQPVKKPVPLPAPRPPKPLVDEPLEVSPLPPEYPLFATSNSGRTSISRSRNSSPRRDRGT